MQWVWHDSVLAGNNHDCPDVSELASQWAAIPFEMGGGRGLAPPLAAPA